MTGRLHNKVAIITGAAQGQGAAEARSFAAEGARVMLTDRNPAGAALASEIGAQATFMQHDVADRAGWTAVVRETVERFGTIDILVNNAGICLPEEDGFADEAMFELHHRINVAGAYLGMASVREAMIAGGGGSIVNTSSGAGLRSYSGLLAYGTSKWALRGLSKYAAAELAPHRIRVNSIHPGLIDTPMAAVNSAERTDAILGMTPMARHGTPEEIALLVVFLASDEASYITGTDLLVDGGYLPSARRLVPPGP